ncbi:MAG: hypothetical protein LUH05_01075 [Candidatus Gastranaerophilales bacterium]|nr:hypothetical protein [Candidatus Gastranaerophilales bacterium]
MKKIKKNKTYKEMLEYRNTNENNIHSKKQVNEIEQYTTNALQTANEDFEESEIEKPVKIQNTKENYDKLLDDIAQYPAKNRTAVLYIVNKVLNFKGYPSNIINIVTTDINQSKSKIQNTYNVANFDFKTGCIYLSEEMLYSLNTQVLTAILVHELDHFDKLAKVCKYMGIQKFKNLFEENNISNIDTNFWSRAAIYANTTDIKPEFYEEALKRFITQNNLELLSSYSDFYRLSENMRNPLEISAYEASDYVYSHYGIEIQEGPMKKMTKKFNDVDWAIYNSISKNPLLKDERIAVFDYFFLKAILNLYPNYQDEFDNCINNKNGDLTDFWLTFENSAKSFYQKGQMDNATYEKMLNLLIQTENEAKKGITPKEGETVLKYKINTLKANLVYPNAINNLKTFSLNYLNYIKSENIIDDEQELQCLFTLICIENELYTNSPNKEISLYYIKIPEEINKLYNLQNKKRKFLFLYNHPAFKNKLTSDETEQQLLIKLLNQSRLNLRVNN